jgi:glutaredoxin
MNIFNEVITHISKYTKYDNSLIIKLMDNINNQINNIIDEDKIYNIMINECSNLIFINKNYNKLLSNIIIYKLHKNIIMEFTNKYSLLYDTIDSNFLNYINNNQNILNKIIQYYRDYYYNNNIIQLLMDTYLLKKNNKIIESPQDLFLRTAIILNYDNLEMIQKTYYYMSLLYYYPNLITLRDSGIKNSKLLLYIFYKDTINIFPTDLINKLNIEYININLYNIKIDNLYKFISLVNNSINIFYINIYIDICNFNELINIYEYININIFLTIIILTNYNKLYNINIWKYIMTLQINYSNLYLVNKNFTNLSNKCVDYNTKILTEDGYISIGLLENKQINIWNGYEWSLVTIQKTNTNKNLIRINFSNGLYIDCTKEHIFYIKDINDEEIKIEAQNLKVNDILINFTLPPPIEFKHYIYFKDAYLNGFYYTNKYIRKNKFLRSFIPIKSTVKNRLNWFQGYCDTNAKYLYIKNTAILSLVSNNKQLLINILYLLNTLGIYSKITKIYNKKSKIQKIFEYILNYIPYCNPYCNPCFNKLFNKINSTYNLIIDIHNIYNLYKLGFRFNNKILKLIKYYEYNKLYLINSIDVIKITSIEDSYDNVNTYCFTEPLRHKGIFNGILCGNCDQINNYNYCYINLKSFIIPFNNNLNNKWFIYTKENCKYSLYIKNYLKNFNIKYTELTNKSILSDHMHKYINELNNINYPLIIIYNNTNNNFNNIGGWDDLYLYINNTFDFNKLYDVVYLATLNLNKNQYYDLLELNIQELSDIFNLLKIEINSDKYNILYSNILETIYLASLTASNYLSQHNKINNNIDSLTNIVDEYILNEQSLYKNEWIKLKNNINDYGLLNNIIINFSPSHSTKIFSNHSKDDIILNKYLINDLIYIGIWSEELKEKIISNNGILDNIDEIPTIFKKIYNIII